MNNHKEADNQLPIATMKYSLTNSNPTSEIAKYHKNLQNICIYMIYMKNRDTFAHLSSSGEL